MTSPHGLTVTSPCLHPWPVPLACCLAELLRRRREGGPIQDQLACSGLEHDVLATREVRRRDEREPVDR